MRLTLRTLLAYLDDVLSPAETKLMGQKIQESPMAQLLVSRIREVMRRRRLKAPDVFGPEVGIDPNIIGQYLNDTLPAEQYADVERILLASDELLAETAACHQVLTMVTETVDLPLEKRERLYALGPVDPNAQLIAPNDTAHSPHSRTPEAITTRSAPPNVRLATAPTHVNDDERITTVPDYLKPAPWSSKILPVMTVLGLIILCAALIGPGVLNGVRQANVELQRRNNREQPAERVAAADLPKPADELSETEPTVNIAANALPKPGELREEPALPQAPPTTEKDDFEEALPSPDSTAVAAITKPNEMPAESPDSDEPDDKASPPKPTPLPPEILAEFEVRYTSTDGVIIKSNEKDHSWYMVPQRSDLRPDDLVANLDPFDATLELDKANIRATLVGESIVKFLQPSGVGLQGIGVIGRGKIVLQPLKPDRSTPGRIAIGIGEDIWTLDLMNDETICGLEVMSREATQFNKFHDFYWYQANLYVLSGAVNWTNSAGQVQQISQRMVLPIIPERAATSRPVPINYPSEPIWCDASRRRAQPLRRFSSQFQKSFAADEPVEQTMLSLMKNTPNPKIAELATRCLAAADDFEGLVETLATCGSEDGRSAAREGLRQWLPMNPNFGPLLKSELDKYYPPDEVEAVYRMLWGFTREDVIGSQVNSRQLAGWLRSPKIEIRELADFWIDRLKGKNDFRANGPGSAREAYINRLEEQIIRDNGLIKGP